MLEEKEEEIWKVYVVECKDKTYYVGIAKDVEGRIAQHNRRRGARYTASRIPVKLLASSRSMSRSEALKNEHRIKKLLKDYKVKAVKEC